VVFDGWRVIFLLGQALNAGMLLAVASSVVLVLVGAGTGVRQARDRTSSPR
jgi:hypothetical protein